MGRPAPFVRIAFSVFVLALAACQPAQRTEPMTFVLAPGAIQIITSPLYVGGRQVTVKLRAASPVDVEFASARTQQAITTYNKIPTLVPCRQVNVLDTTLRCTLGADERNWILVIKDDRNAAGALTSGAAAVFGIKKPAETFLTRNDVFVVSEIAGCFGKCP